jgi:hypothetical protein
MFGWNGSEPLTAAAQLESGERVSSDNGRISLELAQSISELCLQFIATKFSAAIRNGILLEWYLESNLAASTGLAMWSFKYLTAFESEIEFATSDEIIKVRRNKEKYHFSFSSGPSDAIFRYMANYVIPALIFSSKNEVIKGVAIINGVDVTNSLDSNATMQVSGCRHFSTRPLCQEDITFNLEMNQFEARAAKAFKPGYQSQIFPGFVIVRGESVNFSKIAWCSKNYLPELDPFDRKSLEGKTLMMVYVRVWWSQQGYLMETESNHVFCVLFHRRTPSGAWEGTIYDSSQRLNRSTLRFYVGYNRASIRGTKNVMKKVGLLIFGDPNIQWTMGRMELHTSSKVSPDTFGSGICYITACVLSMLLGLCDRGSATSGTEVVRRLNDLLDIIHERNDLVHLLSNLVGTEYSLREDICSEPRQIHPVVQFARRVRNSISGPHTRTLSSLLEEFGDENLKTTLTRPLKIRRVDFPDEDSDA